MSRIGVSIVIPTLGNRENYLREAIESIRYQKCELKEILVVKARKFSSHSMEIDCSDVRFIGGAHTLNPSEARNLGVKYSKYEVISFLDDDDWWGSNYLESVMKCFQEFNCDIVISSLTTSEGRKFDSIKSAIESPEILYYQNPGLTGSNISILKSAFNLLDGFNPNLSTSHDKALIIEATKKRFKIALNESGNAYHRKHNGERASDQSRILRGYEEFYAAYSNEMNYFQSLNNVVRIKKLRWTETKSLLPLFLYIFYSSKLKVISVLKKSERFRRKCIRYTE